MILNFQSHPLLASCNFVPFKFYFLKTKFFGLLALHALQCLIKNNIVAGQRVNCCLFTLLLFFCMRETHL
jgi:hypothetical protein